MHSKTKNRTKTRISKRRSSTRDFSLSRATIIPEDLYCLWEATLKFVLPRLKEFRDWHGCHPMSITFEEWNQILDEIIWFMDTALKTGNLPKQEERERYEQAHKLFYEWFFDLWG